jgi:hypothetical protein
MLSKRGIYSFSLFEREIVRDYFHVFSLFEREKVKRDYV